MEKRKNVIPVLIVLACSIAAEAVEVKSDFRQGLLDRCQVLAAAGAVTSQAYPNANLVQVDDFTRCAYGPDGTGEIWCDNYTKVLTEKGRRERQELSFSYLLPYTTLRAVLLEIIRPDGSVVPVDIEKGSKVMIENQQMSANIYNPNSKVLRLGVPDVQIGDVVHVVTHETILKRRMPHTWDDCQVWESTAPIQHGRYEVHAPQERPLCRIALKNPVEGTVTHRQEQRDGQIVYCWEISQVPRFYVEPAMPPAHTAVQRLLVSTVPDWKSISSWYWQLCRPHLAATTPQMQEMVTTLTRDLTEPQQKIEALFRWASQQVRYLGIPVEEEAPGWEPHDVKTTFDNRHGVCRDKAALLVALLRLAGFDAYPVLIQAGPRKDEEVPLVSFNHAVCAVRHDDGSYQLMDCTDESAKDLFPASLANCSYLVAHPQGESLRTSPFVPAEKNMVWVETTGVVDAQGNLTAQTELQFDGINDSLYRSYLTKAKPEERRRLFEGILKASLPTALVTDFELRPADLQDTTRRLCVHLSLTAQGILVGDGITTMMPVPTVGARVGLLNSILSQTGLQKRRFPLLSRVACGVREKLNLRLDPALGSLVSLPQFLPIHDPIVSWQHTLEQQANVLQSQSEFLLKVVEFDPPQYLQLKEDLKQIEQHRRKRLILACGAGAGPAGPDVVILDRRVEYRVADVHTWTEKWHVRKKILTHKGVKDNAELQLNYNPVWEQVRLVSARVTHAGQVKQVSTREMNLMDAGWVASAPRYPAAQTLVISLPAVEIGSTVEYEYERVKKDRPFFTATHVFRGFDPVEQETVSLTVPASLALRILRDDSGVIIPDGERTPPVIAEREERRGDRVHWEWKVQNQTPLPQEDFLPPLSSFNPVLRITAGDWRTYSQQLHAVLQEAARARAAAAQRAKTLVSRAHSPREKMTAIRDFVARNIRAAGPGCDELPLTAVTPADRTLGEGYGNTTDRAVLLYAMLEAVGLDPEFVLVNYGPSEPQIRRFEIQYPSAYTFGSVLVRLYDGAMPVYLNDTDQYAVLGATPAADHLALSLTRGETEMLSIVPDRREARQYECGLVLAENGDARIALTRQFQGNAFAARHRMYDELPPEERQRYHQELVAEVAQAAVADSNLITDFDSYPGRESFRVRVEKYAVRDGDFLYFELPNALRRPFSLQSDTHQNPFYLDRHLSVHISNVVELPPEFSDIVLAPQPQKWLLPADGGVIQIRVARQDPRADGVIVLTVACEADLNPFILSPVNYPDLLEIEKQLSHPKARTILVARQKHTGPDGPP